MKKKKERIWWTGPWLTAANELFKSQVGAENTPDIMQKMTNEDIVECQNINNVNSEERQDQQKTIKKKVQWDPENYKAVFY